MMMMKAGNSGDIAYCLLRCYSRRQNDVMTSFSVYLFTVPVNLVYVKLWGLATKIRFCSITYIIQKGMAPKKLMKVFPKKSVEQKGTCHAASCGWIETAAQEVVDTPSLKVFQNRLGTNSWTATSWAIKADCLLSPWNLMMMMTMIIIIIIIDVWCGLEQSIFDQATDQWRGRLRACVHMLKEDTASTACELAMLILFIFVTFIVTCLTVASLITLTHTFLIILQNSALADLRSDGRFYGGCS